MSKVSRSFDWFLHRGTGLALISTSFSTTFTFRRHFIQTWSCVYDNLFHFAQYSGQPSGFRIRFFSASSSFHDNPVSSSNHSASPFSCANVLGRTWFKNTSITSPSSRFPSLFPMKWFRVPFQSFFFRKRALRRQHVSHQLSLFGFPFKSIVKKHWFLKDFVQKRMLVVKYSIYYKKMYSLVSLRNNFTTNKRQFFIYTIRLFRDIFVIST